MPQWDLDFIVLLQAALRSPFLDWVFYIISFVGSEYIFLGVTVIIYWCFSKRYAYKFFNVFLVGSLLTGVFKVVVARPRPFEVVETSLESVETNPVAAVLERTEGHSFPSGHSQNAANMATQFSLLAREKSSKKLFVRIAAVGAAVAVLVMFSRMYLGQHYLTDVLAGAALGVFTALLFSVLFKCLRGREEWLFVVVLPLTAVLAAVLIGVNKNPEDIIKLLGASGAMSLGYFLEKLYARYNVKSGAWYKQVIKVLAGAAAVLLIKEGLKMLFDALQVEGRILMLTDFLRYFLMGITASFIVPAVFRLTGM